MDVIAPDRLREVRTLDDVVKLLADELDWPIAPDDLEDALFDYAPEDVGVPAEQVPRLRSLRQLRPLTARQPWGIFFVELSGPRLPITPLRRLLRGLVTRKRASGQRTWALDDLLFFTATEGGGGVELHLLAFFERDDGQPEIRSLPWNPDHSPRHHLERLARELLPRLEWPVDEDDADAWRDGWRDAFRLRPGEALRSASELAERMAEVALDLRDAIGLELGREDGEGPFTRLREEVAGELWAGVDDDEFADMCAQTLVSGALTARIVDPVGFGASPVLTAVPLANPFLAAFFEQVHDQVTAIDLEAAGLEGLVADLRRTNVEAVLDQFGSTATGGDPVIHFYEHFLAAYDPGIRADAGAYFTPKPVVNCIVRLVDDALRERFGLAEGVADTGSWREVTERTGTELPGDVDPDTPFVSMLDPATGTGTFLVSWLRQARASFGREVGWAERLREHVLPGMHAFERLLAPYAVAHLKLALEVGGDEEAQASASILLTDTLEWPDAAPRIAGLDPVAAEGQRAGAVKGHGRPTVVLGNPPYQRVKREDVDGWVVHAEGGRPALMQDVRDVANARTIFSHVASLENRYVYFWRWAIWKALEQSTGAPGVVAFITASSWLDGPGFVGLRELARTEGSELWITDLGGDNRGTDTDENVFDIETPVAIAVLVRAEPTDEEMPARVFHRRVRGARAEKLAELATVRAPDLEPEVWTELPSVVYEPLKPAAGGQEWHALPALTDLLPWQQPGQKLNRKWPIAPDPETLSERWSAFLEDPNEKRRSELFPDKDSGRTVYTQVGRHPTLASLPVGAEPERVAAYQYRPFDRQWTFADPRLAKTDSPSLWQAASERQLCLAAPTSIPLGSGPAVIAFVAMPDLDVFRGSFGGKNILPLYRDAAAREPNLPAGLLETIGDILRATNPECETPTPENLLGYVYALLSTPAYQLRFQTELADRVIRVPLTADPLLFTEAVDLGGELLWLHTFGERFTTARGGDLPDAGLALVRPIKRLPEDKRDLRYDEATLTLDVADGRITGVRPEVWSLEVSGWGVVARWLEHRTRKGRGRKSSELDDIRPDQWHESWTRELLDLLRALHGSLALQPTQDDLLARICDGALIAADNLPTPTATERAVPKTIRHGRRTASLLEP